MVKLVPATAGDALGDGDGLGDAKASPGLGEGSATAGLGTGAAADGVGEGDWPWQAVTRSKRARATVV